MNLQKFLSSDSLMRAIVSIISSSIVNPNRLTEDKNRKAFQQNSKFSVDVRRSSEWM